MYHLKEDKRVKTSAKLICEALNKSLKTKKINEITIIEIQQKSTVGRATFYRLFDNLTDVLAFQCDNMMLELMESTEKLNSDSKGKMLNFMSGIMEHSELLETIINSGHIEIIYQSHLKFIDVLSKNLIDTKGISKIETEYMLNVLTYIMIGVLITWVKNGKKESVEELYNIIKKTTKFA